MLDNDPLVARALTRYGSSIDKMSKLIASVEVSRYTFLAFRRVRDLNFSDVVAMDVYD